MFAPTEPGGSGGGTPAPAPEPKYRTVTLTNRRPIKFKEDEWPVVAQATIKHEEPECPMIYWSLEMRVRMSRYSRYIVYAVFSYNDEIHDDYQTVRVGHFIRLSKGDEEEEAIRTVGKELRERIRDKGALSYVTALIDRCFEDMGPQVV
jgi:hypothetical protein